MKFMKVLLFVMVLFGVGCANAEKTKVIAVEIPVVTKSQAKIFVEKIDLSEAHRFFINDNLMHRVLDESFNKTKKFDSGEHYTFKLDMEMLADEAEKSFQKYPDEEINLFRESIIETAVTSGAFSISDTPEKADYILNIKLKKSIILSEGVLIRTLLEYEYLLTDKNGIETVKRNLAVIGKKYSEDKNDLHKKLVSRIVPDLTRVIEKDGTDFDKTDIEIENIELYNSLRAALNRFNISRKLSSENGNYTFTIYWDSFFRNRI